MSFDDLLRDRCTIQSHTVDSSGMTDTETFADTATDVPCRKLTRSSASFNPNKAQYGTVIRTRFAFTASQSIAIRQRIVQAGRTYDVVDVIPAGDATEIRHTVAVCEAVAGDV
ncbi:MAG: hypothetical protein JWP89_2637 [Schlesneria sp.]|nr:hypothetical protein [Schlesneria sp.]